MPQPNGLSPAGSQLFAAGTGLGDALRQQVGETAEELRKRRLLEMQGRPDLGAGFGTNVLGPMSAFTGRR
jgi:hypothetical protein